MKHRPPLAGAFLLYVSLCLLFLRPTLCDQQRGKYELLQYHPKANAKAVVSSGNARFTVLTNRLIRMEYSSKGVFEDRATVAFVNRLLPVPEFHVSNETGELTISTDRLKLTYIKGRPFSPSSLKITSLGYSDALDTFDDWSYGMVNHGQLFGTIRSLDELNVISLNCSDIAGKMVHDELLHCNMGLISRNGWVVVNDSLNYALTNEYWWDGMNTDDVDSYFFGHGLRYKDALMDYTLVGGKIAMWPKYAGGIMWTRWYNFDNLNVMRVVDDYVDRSIPLDVFIIDMDWHTKQGWGGYTFDKRLFPIPSDALSFFHHHDIHSAVNLHDDDGVRSDEIEYSALAHRMHFNTDKNATIPFSIVNSTYVYGLEDIVLQHVEDVGVDFWWIDWQQGGTQGGAKGDWQNPTIWLNHIRSTDHLRRNQDTRGLILARWGGLGNHRYQVGFSGDVAQLTWSNLAFQPYFSMCGTNVGFGFWSHDLVGPHDDHELHTRWLQWGAWSAIFRTHDRGMSAGQCNNANPPNCAIVEVWNVPQLYADANRAAIRQRAALGPYIYTAQRQAFNTGLSIIRPMYYDYPQGKYAYGASPTGALGQYLFGEDLLISPVVHAAPTNTSMAVRSVWLPPKEQWFALDTGVLISGSDHLYTTAYDLRSVPVFVRGGSVLPSISIPKGSALGLAHRQWSDLTFTVYPGSSSGHTSIYEDDGMTTDYLNDQYVNTTASYTRTSSSISFTLSSTGAYPSFPSTRPITLRLPNTLPAKSVTIDGKSVPYGRWGGPNTWHYDGTEFALVVESASLATNAPVHFEVDFIDDVDDSLMSGLKGIVKHSTWAKHLFDQTRNTPGAHSVSGGTISEVSSKAKLLEYVAGTTQDGDSSFSTTLKGLKALFRAAKEEIKAMKPAITRGADKAHNYDRWAHAIELMNTADV